MAGSHAAGTALKYAEAKKCKQDDEAQKYRPHIKHVTLGIETEGGMTKDFLKLVETFARLKADKVLGPLPTWAKRIAVLPLLPNFRQFFHFHKRITQVPSCLAS